MKHSMKETLKVHIFSTMLCIAYNATKNFKNIAAKKIGKNLK